MWYYKISWREAPPILKNYIFYMIVIHIGIPMYPQKDWAENGIVFSKHIICFIFRVIQNKPNWVFKKSLDHSKLE